MLRTAEVVHLRGQIAFDQRRGSDAVRLLVDAARRLAPLDAGLARETYLQALSAAIWAGAHTGEIAEAARTAPPAGVPPRAVDLVLDALATRLTEGYAAAAAPAGQGIRRRPRPRRRPRHLITRAATTGSAVASGQ